MTLARTQRWATQVHCPAPRHAGTACDDAIFALIYMYSVSNQPALPAQSSMVSVFISLKQSVPPGVNMTLQTFNNGHLTYAYTCLVLDTPAV